MDSVSSSSDETLERHSGSSSASADVSGSETLSFSREETPNYQQGRHGDDVASCSQRSSPAAWPLPAPPPLAGGRETVVWGEKGEKRDRDLSEVEMMKERFAKLLLGEDMSGGGKGVCTALAISNAITNLSASVFGELWRLEPLAPQKKSMWRREMEWLLCVSDSIVELIPAWQDFPEGGGLEVMVSRPRSDLYINLPALRKLDAMLLETLDSFCDTEFWYVDRGIFVADANDDGCVPVRQPSQRQEEKWWLPTPRVPPDGLSDSARKQLHHHRECTNQILKAAMAINSHVLSEMEVPSVYLDTLPKSGKASLGDIIYRYITAEQFSPDCLLDCLDLSSEHHTLEIANRIEAAIHVWQRKLHGKLSHNAKDNRCNTKSSWGMVKDLVGDIERRELLAERAESLMLSLKLRFPGLSQTILDMNKIQYNKDVGQSILESYSRVLESLAFNIIARIDDLIYVDDMTKHSASLQYASIPPSVNSRAVISTQKRVPTPFSLNLSSSTPYATPFATPNFSPTRLASPGRASAPPFINCKSSAPQNKPLAHFLGSEKKAGDGNSNSFARQGKSALAEMGKPWSYTENLESKKDLTSPPERD